MRSTPWLACTLGAAFLTIGCGAPTELDRRFQAQEARWRVDQWENRAILRGDELTDEQRAEVAAEHLRIAETFWPDEGSPRTAKAIRDRSIRREIAAGSELYALDLLSIQGVSHELAIRYDELAERASEQPAFHVHAQVRAAWIREHLGDLDSALRDYTTIARAYSPTSSGYDELAEEIRALLWEIDVHRGVLAKWMGEKESHDDRARLATRASDLEAAASNRLEAERLFLIGEIDSSFALLGRLADESVTEFERASWKLEIGEMRQLLGLHDESTREYLYEASMASGTGATSVRARRLLARWHVERNERHEALVILDDLVSLPTREAQVQRGRLLLDRARVHSSLRLLQEAAQDRLATIVESPGSPAALGAAAELTLSPDAESREHSRELLLETAQKADPRPFVHFHALTLLDRAARAESSELCGQGASAIRKLRPAPLEAESLAERLDTLWGKRVDLKSVKKRIKTDEAWRG